MDPNSQEFQENATPSITTLKLPEFWPADSELWFIHIEAQFRRHRIASQTAKNDYVACQGAAWIAVFVAGATVLFCTKQWGDGDHLPPPWMSAAYASCHRLVWAICIAWLVFACISDRGGLVNSVLSSPHLVPLSRLSYAVYVLHVPIVWFRLWTIRERILIWFLPMFYNAMGTLVLSFFVALGASIFIERPLVAAKDLAVGLIMGPRNHKPSNPDGRSNNRGGRSDVLSETRRRGPSVASIASKLSGCRIFAKQSPTGTTTPVFQSESCTVHL
ncbi:hypothetical protein HPB52_006038 [Rhipicephalus sanguineus]|uniref:DUF7041 domain-containing protein n=1 Tax=Rhipicephalus sanguineus TaxID=34632 RepID=A0A9D4T774_RHISA|nr:hypothetical protein HPB52_006038 [Rhipicephalus sanguineus]